MVTVDDSLKVLDPIFIVYPSYNNINEYKIIIDALSQETRQVHLQLRFHDDIFDESEEIREAILLASKKTLGLLTKVSCYNACTNRKSPQQQLHTCCLEFFCQLLEVRRNRNHDNNRGAGVEEFGYYNYESFDYPLTMIDADKVAMAIASNSNIKKLEFEDVFDERGSFECIFNAVLDGGITNFIAEIISRTQAELCAIDITNLANNTTLKSLHLVDGFSPSRSICTEFTEQFATQLVNILKTNRSLEELIISPNMLDNAGRKQLLNSLKEENNSTLLKLDTYGANDSIQLKINTELEWNHIWKRYNTNYGLPAIGLEETKKKTTTALEIDHLRKKKKKKEEEEKKKKKKKEEEEEKKKKEEEEHGKKNISLAIYPLLLEVLQNRPTHLYKFLQKENHRLCEEYYAN